MATSRKGSWRFFQKHQSFSQWGGVMEEYRSIQLRCFLSLWLHSSIREYVLHTAKCDISTFKGTRGSGIPMFISDKGIRKPVRTHTLLPPEWFSTSCFSFSHLLHSYQKQAGLTGTVRTVSMPGPANKVSCDSFEVYLFTTSVTFESVRKTVEKWARPAETAWIPALSLIREFKTLLWQSKGRFSPIRFPSFNHFTEYITVFIFPLPKNTMMYISHVYVPCFFSFFEFILFHILASFLFLNLYFLHILRERRLVWKFKFELIFLLDSDSYHFGFLKLPMPFLLAIEPACVAIRRKHDVALASHNISSLGSTNWPQKRVRVLQ